MPNDTYLNLDEDEDQFCKLSVNHKVMVCSILNDPMKFQELNDIMGIKF